MQSSTATPGAKEVMIPGGKPTQKEILIGLAKENCTFFHTPDMIAYAEVSTDGHREVWPVKSHTFRLYLERLFHKETGGSPSTNARSEALSTLEALARFDGKEHPVHRRVAREGNGIVIDLGTTDWNIVLVSKDGWEILKKSLVRFHRGKDQLALPVPMTEGKIDRLFSFLNIPAESDRLLFLAWLIFSLMPGGPYVILVLRAGHGSGKSATSRFTLCLIDPRKGGLRAFPKDERDLAIAATNGWLMAFDNLSHIPADISDALCRLTHGAGFATRTLYENTEETIIDAKRPILMNSISDIIDRPDLADRVLLIELPPLIGTRKTEKQLEDEFEAEAPALFGAVLDLMVKVLRILPGVGYENLPRMADFARVGIAVEEALGYETGTFMTAYRSKREDLTANVLDHPVVQAILHLLEKPAASPWTGIVQELKVKLEAIASESDRRSTSWPKSPKGLSNKLRNFAPSLRAQGIAIEFGGHSEGGNLVTIKKTEEERTGKDVQHVQDVQKQEPEPSRGLNIPLNIEENSLPQCSAQCSGKKFSNDNNSELPEHSEHKNPTFSFQNDSVPFDL